MTRGVLELVFGLLPVEVPVLACEAQAPSPTARMPAAATVRSLRWLLNLLMCFVFPVVDDRGAVEGGGS
jgi:hypothetical protein